MKKLILDEDETLVVQLGIFTCDICDEVDKEGLLVNEFGICFDCLNQLSTIASRIKNER